jgi:hypothetical protein
MTRMSKPDHIEVLHGREAQAVLDNEAFKRAMSIIRDSVREQWLACPIRDKEGQTLLLQLAKLTEKFESTLIGMVKSGEFAQRRIDIDSEREESLPRRYMRRAGM